MFSFAAQSLTNTNPVYDPPGRGGGGKSRPFGSLYYITHVKNLPSILSRGILCHERVDREGIQFEPIYNPDIVARRKSRLAPDGRNLWAFANLYFQPRNPMLFRVLRDPEKPRGVEEVVILAVSPHLVNRPDVFISTGNAASAESDLLRADEGRKAIPQIMRDTDAQWWKREDGSFRKMMAECLVPDVVDPSYIHTIYVATRDTAAAVRPVVRELELPVVTEPDTFFEPVRAFTVSPNLVLLEGDMFFSKRQTLTVSVNCVGVMGKGLASRAKYQFPDVYVFYQDLCRKRILRLGRPYLYKRESFFEHELADEPSPLPNGNGPQRFLLFPTKQHWRQAADIKGIEKGLAWVQQNYRSEGVRSLAMPALGCGLGRLEWGDVGPLLCRYVSSMDIPVEIYLPAEKRVPDEYLTKEFLLAGD